MVQETGGGILFEKAEIRRLADAISTLWKIRPPGTTGPQRCAGRPSISGSEDGARAVLKRVQEKAAVAQLRSRQRISAPRGSDSILSGISLSLNRGDAASIVGPSGSGKARSVHFGRA
jgi:ABC-type glutathione transport system ATPase component